MKLYEINEKMEMILRAFYEGAEDSETLDTLEADLETLELTREEKLLNCAYVIRNAQAYSNALKEETKRLSERAKREDRKTERIFDYVRACGGIPEGEKWEKDGHGYKWTSGESVALYEGVEPEELPEMYRRVSIEADKTALKKALKAGEFIEGVKLVKSFNLRVL